MGKILTVVLMFSVFQSAALHSQLQEPLRVLVMHAEPFLHLDAAGEPKGYEYSILESFAQSLDRPLELVWIETDIHDMLLQLERGTGDIAAAALTITSGRLERFDFSRPHFPTLVVLVERRGQESDDLEDLVGKRILVEAASSYEEALRQVEGVIPVQALETESYDQWFEHVLQGKVDGIVIDSSFYLFFAEKYQELGLSLALSEPQNFGFALRQDDPLKAQLDAHVEGLQKNGQLREFLREAFGTWGESVIDEMTEGFLDSER